MGKFISLLFDHGPDPAEATYVCVYFPTTAVDEMPQRVEDFAAQAVYGHSDTGHFLQYGPFTGLVFFRPGSLQHFSADRPCFLAWREAEPHVRWSVYEPSWTDCGLNITLPFPVEAASFPASCRVADQTLSLDAAAGVPVAGKLSRATKNKP